MHLNPIINAKGEIVKAGCVVINHKHEILLVTNKKRNEWALPKGHAEAGEKSLDVALRETREETGYEVAVIKPLADMTYISGKTHMPIRVHYFLAHALQQNGDAEGPWEWVELGKAKSLVAANVKEFLDAQLG